MLARCACRRFLIFRDNTAHEKHSTERGINIIAISRISEGEVATTDGRNSVTISRDFTLMAQLDPGGLSDRNRLPEHIAFSLMQWKSFRSPSKFFRPLVEPLQYLFMCKPM